MSTSASSSDATPGKDGGHPGPAAPAPAAGKKTNVCLICGIYTNLSLNIFEPRNGPNIREVIYQKYNFRAERSDTEDKYICFSCNNWLINWYSLQHLSESRNYESTPSSSRQSQSSENRNKRPKNNGRSSAAPGSSRDKENLEQDNAVSSTVKSPEKENASPKRKPKRPSGAVGRPVLKLSSQHNMISSSTNCNSSSSSNTINSTTLVKPFESHLIRMLENQGTSVIKESKVANSSRNQTETPVISTRPGSQLMDSANNNSDIILSFNSAISEVVNVLPSLKSLRQDHLSSCNENEQIDQDFLRTHRMSRSLSISLINSATNSLAAAAEY